MNNEENNDMMLAKRQAQLIIDVEQFSTDHKALDALRAAVTRRYITKVPTLDEKLFELRQGMACPCLGERNIVQLEHIIALFKRLRIQEKAFSEEDESSEEDDVPVRTFAEVCYQLSTRKNGNRAMELLASMLGTTPKVNTVANVFKWYVEHPHEDKDHKVDAVYRVLRDTLRVDLNTVQEYVNEQAENKEKLREFLEQEKQKYAKVLAELRAKEKRTLFPSGCTNAIGATSIVEFEHDFPNDELMMEKNKSYYTQSLLKELRAKTKTDAVLAFKNDVHNALFGYLYKQKHLLKKQYWAEYESQCRGHYGNVTYRMRLILKDKNTELDPEQREQCWEILSTLSFAYTNMWNEKLRDAKLFVGPTAYNTWREFFRDAMDKWKLQDAAVDYAKRNLGTDKKPWGDRDATWLMRAGVPNDVVMVWHQKDFAHDTISVRDLFVGYLRRERDTEGAAEFSMPVAYKSKKLYTRDTLNDWIFTKEDAPNDAKGKQEEEVQEAQEDTDSKGGAKQTQQKQNVTEQVARACYFQRELGTLRAVGFNDTRVSDEHCLKLLEKHTLDRTCDNALLATVMDLVKGCE